MRQKSAKLRWIFGRQENRSKIRRIVVDFGKTSKNNGNECRDLQCVLKNRPQFCGFYRSFLAAVVTGDTSLHTGVANG